MNSLIQDMRMIGSISILILSTVLFFLFWILIVENLPKYRTAAVIIFLSVVLSAIVIIITMNFSLVFNEYLKLL